MALDADARRAFPQREQVVVDGEPLRFRCRQRLMSLSPRPVQIAALRGADVARDAGARPTEVVGRRDVDEHVEAFGAKMCARLDEASGVDDERCLPERVALRDEPRGLPEPHLATRSISYAWG